MNETVAIIAGSSPPVPLALRASGEASSPKRAALPDALLRGLKLPAAGHEPPVYIPNLQEETILAVSDACTLHYTTK